MSTLNVGNLNVTGSLNLPTYSTAQRNQLTGLVSGVMIFNNTTNTTEVYDGTGWVGITSASSMSASGGNTVTNIGGYKIHIFTTDGDFTVTTAPPGQTVEVLIVGGGGGGGNGIGGGGGGVGMVEGNTSVAS